MRLRSATNAGKPSGLIDITDSTGPEGARQHQAIDAPGVTCGQHLRDDPAERGAEHMGAPIAKRCDQRGSIVGEFLETVGLRRLRVAPESRWS
jgi:hypothetical protein